MAAKQQVKKVNGKWYASYDDNGLSCAGCAGRGLESESMALCKALPVCQDIVWKPIELKKAGAAPAHEPLRVGDDAWYDPSKPNPKEAFCVSVQRTDPAFKVLVVEIGSGTDWTGEIPCKVQLGGIEQLVTLAQLSKVV